MTRTDTYQCDFHCPLQRSRWPVACSFCFVYRDNPPWRPSGKEMVVFWLLAAHVERWHCLVDVERWHCLLGARRKGDPLVEVARRKGDRLFEVAWSSCSWDDVKLLFACCFWRCAVSESPTSVFFGGCLKNCLNGNPAELSLRWQGTLPRLRLWRTRGYGVSRNECSLLASLPGEHLLGNWWPTFGQQDCRRHGGTFFTTSTCQPGKTPSNDKNKKCDARTPSRQAVRPFLKMSIWRGILPGPTHANLEPTHRCDGCSCIILSLEW